MNGITTWYKLYKIDDMQYKLIYCEIFIALNKLKTFNPKVKSMSLNEKYFDIERSICW